jgi:hypothetical protein
MVDMKRPSPARMVPYPVEPDRYERPTAPLARRLARANLAKVARMSKRKASTPKPQRRPRAEIDRNYFFGDVLIKTGVAAFVALVMIGIFTPFTLMGAIEDGMYDYVAVMGGFAFLGLVAFFTGRHLRHEATHWDFD